MPNIKEAIAYIDNENAKDPNLENWMGENHPKELVYGQRMSEWLLKLNPEPSDELKIAVRGQHIKRWEIPRSNFPKDRVGYFKWRNELKLYHAGEVGKGLKGLGFSQGFIDRVSFLIEKKNLKNDPETQMLEDTACLVFLQFYFEEFSTTEDVQKVVSIVKKTWNKMSDAAKSHALRISMKDDCLEIVKSAIL